MGRFSTPGKALPANSRMLPQFFLVKAVRTRDCEETRRTRAWGAKDGSFYEEAQQKHLFKYYYKRYIPSEVSFGCQIVTHEGGGPLRRSPVGLQESLCLKNTQQSAFISCLLVHSPQGGREATHYSYLARRSR